MALRAGTGRKAGDIMGEIPEEFYRKFQESLGESKAPDEIPDSTVDFATAKALSEIEQIKKAYETFRASIEGLVATQYLTPIITALPGAIESMHDLVEDNIDTSKLSKKGMDDYVKAQRVRGEILARVYNKYHKEDK